MSKEERDLEAAVDNIAAADREVFLRVVPPYIGLKNYEDYYFIHKDVLTELDKTWLEGDYKKYFYLHSEEWWFDALRNVYTSIFAEERHMTYDGFSKDKCAVFDALLADTRAANLRNHRNDAVSEPWEDNFDADEWAELLEHFNIHGFHTFDRSHRYLNDAEQAEWAALPEELTAYIGEGLDGASSGTRFWTLDYDRAEREASSGLGDEISQIVISKAKVKGYLNRHGRREIVIDERDVDTDDLETYKAFPDSSPLES